MSLDPYDLLDEALELYQKGATQADFRRKWKVGTAQKMFYVMEIYNRMRNHHYNLIEELRSKRLDIHKGNKEDLREASKRRNLTISDVEKLFQPPNLKMNIENASGSDNLLVSMIAKTVNETSKENFIKKMHDPDVKKASNLLFAIFYKDKNTISNAINALECILNDK